MKNLPTFESFITETYNVNENIDSIKNSFLNDIKDFIKPFNSNSYDLMHQLGIKKIIENYKKNPESIFDVLSSTNYGISQYEFFIILKNNNFDSKKIQKYIDNKLFYKLSKPYANSSVLSAFPKLIKDNVSILKSIKNDNLDSLLSKLTSSNTDIIQFIFSTIDPMKLTRKTSNELVLSMDINSLKHYSSILDDFTSAQWILFLGRALKLGIIPVKTLQNYYIERSTDIIKTEINNWKYPGMHSEYKDSVLNFLSSLNSK